MTNTRALAPAATAAGLYTASLAIEALTALLRLALLGLLMLLVKALLDHPLVSLIADTLTVALSFGPIMLSLLALGGLPGGALERFALGARTLSEREHDTLTSAYAQLPAGLRGPRRTYVIDSPELNAFVIGDVLYLHRELIHDQHLPAVIAHELAHLGPDGRLILALRRFTLPIGRQPGILAGGLSCRLLQQPWLAWWRHREHRADHHASQLGHGQGLADLLERTQLLDAAAPFMHNRTHPYTEHRIDRLRKCEGTTRV